MGKKKVAKKVAKKKAGGKKKKAAKKPKKKKAKKVKRGSLRRVWSGTVATSKGGLTKNKSGKVVSKKRHAQGLKAYKGISKWTAAFMKARKELKIKGFVACKKGTAFYKCARKHYGK